MGRADDALEGGDSAPTGQCARCVLRSTEPRIAHGAGHLAEPQRAGNAEDAALTHDARACEHTDMEEGGENDMDKLHGSR
jgi:hypothetical protein